MKDLDFDELDRAVSSLMEPLGAKKPVADAPSGAAPTTDAPTSDNGAPATISSHDAGQLSAPTSTPADSRPERPSASTPPAVKRTGRFMDVVHPSYAMKAPTSVKQPEPLAATAPTRDGTPQTTPETPAFDPHTRLEDDYDDTTETAESSDTAAVAAAEQVAVKESPEDTIAAPVSEWGDPIDFHMQQLAQAEKDQAIDAQQPVEPIEPPVADETAETTVEPSLAQHDEPTESLEGSDAPASDSTGLSFEPIASPFLSDAKVEKRPLGAFATSSLTPDDEGASETEATGTSTGDTQPSDQQTTPNSVILPEELKHDIVSIEAGVTRSDASEPAASNEPAAVEPEPETPSAPVQRDDESDDTPVHTTPARSHFGGAAITQQYTESQSSTPEEHAPVYDSAAETPIKHPAKKRSAATTIIVILLLLVLGAAGGAAYYFFLM